VSARCRSCNAEIIWAVTENGKRIPLDVAPAERPTGLFRLGAIVPDFNAPRAIAAGSEPVYLSHFVTCPNAAQHRRIR
jgi:hypothetical protein